MQSRIKNPAGLFPDAMQALMALHAAVEKSGLSPTISGLVHMRVSQVNGCSVCVDLGWRQLKRAGEKDERIFCVSAWRDTPYFTEAERAALALAEAATRVADSPDPVPDQVGCGEGMGGDARNCELAGPPTRPSQKCGGRVCWAPQKTRGAVWLPDEGMICVR